MTIHRIQDNDELEHIGFKCPKCGSMRIEVVETCNGPDYVIRRRRCKANRHTFITKEVICTSKEYNDWRKTHPK